MYSDEDEKDIAYNSPNKYPVLVSDEEFEKLFFSGEYANVEMSADLDPNPNCPLCTKGDTKNHSHELLFFENWVVFRVVRFDSE